jgi:hypothetical protein
VGRVGFALAPLVERLKHLLRQQNMLHADETPVAQLDPGQGKTKRAYLWAYRSVDSPHSPHSPHSNAPRIVVFDYQSGRAGKHAANFLQDWKAQPKLAQLLDWLNQTLQSSAPNSAIARATSYALKRWSALTRYADNGQRPIDNNPVENAIRPIAIGRKNWLVRRLRNGRPTRRQHPVFTLHRQTQRLRACSSGLKILWINCLPA